MDTRFPLTITVGFKKFPLDVGLRLDVEFIPVTLRQVFSALHVYHPFLLHSLYVVVELVALPIVRAKLWDYA